MAIPIPQVYHQRQLLVAQAAPAAQAVGHPVAARRPGPPIRSGGRVERGGPADAVPQVQLRDPCNVRYIREQSRPISGVPDAHELRRGSDRPGRGDWIDHRRARHLRQAVHLPQGLGPPAFRVRHGCPRGRPSPAVTGTGRGGCAFEKVGSGRLARVAGRGRRPRVPHRRRAQDSRLGPDVCDLHASWQCGGGGHGERSSVQARLPWQERD